MPERNIFDPQSMVGATPEELLAVKPPGWLVRPFPPGQQGFRLMSPGRMPGAEGTISWHGPTPEFRYFQNRPEPRVFILNCVLEFPLLVDAISSWAGSYDDIEDGVAEIPRIARPREAAWAVAASAGLTAEAGGKDKTGSREIS